MIQQSCLDSYIAKNKNEKEKKNSSSGGMFSVFANYIIENNGIVCGAVYNDDMKVVHTIVDNKDALSKLRGSKYVQSDIGDCYKKIKNALIEEKKVLFVGCPCQTAALRTYLKKDYPRQLFVVDFICHGILSQNLFDDYIEYLGNKFRSKVVSFNFRDKTDGWAETGPKVVFENGKSKHWPLYEDTYMQGYFKSLCMKQSCYTCKYKNYHSGSDITISDYWGCENNNPEFYDFYGVSAVIIQTENGKILFNNVLNEIDYLNVPIENIIKYNEGLIKPFAEGTNRKQFLELVENGKFYIDALVEMNGCKKSIKRTIYKLKRRVRIIHAKYKNNSKY